MDPLDTSRRLHSAFVTIASAAESDGSHLAFNSNSSPASAVTNGAFPTVC
jgi:hypothetical protein